MSPDEEKARLDLAYRPHRGYAPQDDTYAADCLKAFAAEVNREWQAFVAAACSQNTLPVETVLCDLAGMFAAHAPPFALIEVSHVA